MKKSHTNSFLIAIWLGWIIVLGLNIFPAALTADAQTEGINQTSSIPEDYVTPYDSSYPLWDISRSMNELVAIQTATHLAKHGSSTHVRGEISSYILDEINRVTQELGVPEDWRSNCCTVDVFNEDGVMIAHYPLNFTSEGAGVSNFNSFVMVEPRLYSEGQVYTVKPGFHLAESVMDAVNPEVYFYLTTLPQAEFIVATPSVINVLAENKTFDVPIASNSIVSDFNFSQSEKKISFSIDANNASKIGVAQLAIPNELLWGEIMILRDGKEIPLNEAIIVFQKDVFYIVEVNYTHDERHIIEILGTQVIPEFLWITLIFPASTGLMIGSLLYQKRLRSLLLG